MGPTRSILLLRPEPETVRLGAVVLQEPLVLRRGHVDRARDAAHQAGAADVLRESAVSDVPFVDRAENGRAVENEIEPLGVAAWGVGSLDVNDGRHASSDITRRWYRQRFSARGLVHQAQCSRSDAVDLPGDTAKVASAVMRTRKTAFGARAVTSAAVHTVHAAGSRVRAVVVPESFSHLTCRSIAHAAIVASLGGAAPTEICPKRAWRRGTVSQ